MGPWDDCSGRLQMHLELLKKSCLLSPLSDMPLERRYGEPYSALLYDALMAKHMEDVVTIFQCAIVNGHVQQVRYQADLGEVFIRFIDNATLLLAEPISSRIIAEIWEESCKWEGRKLGERLKEIDREYEKERKESMNTNYLDTAVHYRNGGGISVTAFDCKISTIPEVKLIQRRGRCTIVKWEDGTETKVVLEEGKPDTGIFGAYCIALAKKCAGSTEKLLRTIDDHDERVIKCRYLARVQELREKRLKKAAEERKLKWESDVEAAMYDSRVRDEAIKRLWAKEEKEEL